MATSQSQPTLVTINVNSNAPFAPEMLYQLQQSISSNYDVTAVVVPNPSISKLIDVTSDSANQDTINSIEAESTATLIQLIEAASQTNQ